MTLDIEQAAEQLFKEAIEEDRREGGQFGDGFAFAAFFPEDDPEAVREAWLLYKDHWFNRGLVL